MICVLCTEGQRKQNIRHLFGLQNSFMLSKGKKLFPKASHLGVHIIYTLYIFAETLWFFVWFLYISIASLSFLYIKFSICISLYSVFCILDVQTLSKRCNFLMDVIEIIPTNQLMLCLICHFNKKIRNKREKKQPFPPRGIPVSYEILAKLRNIRKRFF